MESLEGLVVVWLVRWCVEVLGEMPRQAVMIALHSLIEPNRRRVREQRGRLPVQAMIWNIGNIHDDESGRAGKRRVSESRGHCTLSRTRDHRQRWNRVVRALYHLNNCSIHGSRI